MRSNFMSLVHWLLMGVFLLTGCGNPSSSSLTPTPKPVTVKTILKIDLLYPIEGSKDQIMQIQMGQTIKGIVRVTDIQGRPVQDANVTLTFNDPNGELIGSIPAIFGDGDVYRTEAWTIPHNMEEGLWSITVNADTDEGHGQSTEQITIYYSTSEVLYHKYGFWLDEPTLVANQTMLGAERGDAENGLIRWGGTRLSQHVLPENWVEVQWRKGKYDLSSPQAARKFLLEDVGEIGFTRVREIGEFEKTTFKRWEAWVAPARGQFYYTIMQWTVFYAPEVDKTFAISTTTVQAPKGINANEVLLEHFDIDPNIHAEGVAPTPLIPLLPKPTLVSPELGARFTGLEQPIILKWEPLKELAEDEYYQVTIDYNYEEDNIPVKYTTRDTDFTLPEALYRQPNCSAFNWRVTLIQQTGVDEDGNPQGKALSYESLYWYVLWFYPPDEKALFNPLCPNAQY